MTQDRSLEGVLKNLATRVRSLERKIPVLGHATSAGGGGGGGSFTLPPRLVADLPQLPGGAASDLNTVLDTGWYIQNLTVNAQSGANYPIDRAGHLEVSGGLFGTGADLIFQTYTEYAPVAPATVARQWRRTHYNGTWSPWTLVSPVDTVEGVPALPPPSRFNRSADTTSVTSTATWGQTVAGDPATITTDRPLWVLVTFGAWLIASAGETRAGIRLSGATACEPHEAQPEFGAAETLWGMTHYVSAADSGGSGSVQRSAQRVYRLNPGTTNFAPVCYMATAGTHNVNYSVLEVSPIAYVDEPVPVTPTVGVLTRHFLGAAQNVGATMAHVSFDTVDETSGHFTYDAGANAFTCVVPGTYRLALSLSYGQSPSGTYGRALILVNGANYADATILRATAVTQTALAVGTAALAVGDVVTFQFGSSTADGQILVQNDRTYCELVPVAVRVATVDAEVEDTGWIGSGVFAAATGWQVDGYGIRRIGKHVQLRYINFSRTGADVTVGANGDITNQIIATFTNPAFQPAQSHGLHAAPTGRVAGGSVASNGVTLAALSPGSNILTTNILSLAGSWLID